jgi:hypothetical protein
MPRLVLLLLLLALAAKWVSPAVLDGQIRFHCVCKRCCTCVLAQSGCCDRAARGRSVEACILQDRQRF